MKGVRRGRAKRAGRWRACRGRSPSGSERGPRLDRETRREVRDLSGALVVPLLGWSELAPRGAARFMAFWRELRRRAGFGCYELENPIDVWSPAGSGGLTPFGLLGTETGQSAVRNRTVQVGAFTHAFLSSFVGPAGRGRPGIIVACSAPERTFRRVTSSCSTTAASVVENRACPPTPRARARAVDAARGSRARWTRRRRP